MSDQFIEVLRSLGHIYEPRPAGFVVAEAPRRHILKLFVPTGEVKPICGAQKEERGLGCPALWLDADCERCAEIEGNGPALTKRSLMLDLVNNLCTIEQHFLDVMYWNFHNRDKEPINPDPDGELAKGWGEQRTQLVQMMARFRPTMERHEGRFSWPEEVSDGVSGDC